MLMNNSKRTDHDWALPPVEEVPLEGLPKWERLHVSPHASPRSILIVDDVPDIRLMLQEGLEDHGYFCETAQHGVEALRMLRTYHYDIVLTDLQMPFLDGIELAKFIHEDQSLGTPMVIMMTASDNDILAPLALKLGIKKILSKPCLPSEIHQVIIRGEDRFPHAA